MQFCRRIVTTLLLGSVVSCTEPTGPPEDLRLMVAAGPYMVGDTIQLELRNGTFLEAGYNLCFAELERRSGGAWERIRRADPELLCFAVLRSLPPGARAVENQAVEDWMPAGTYRFRHDVEWPIGEARPRVELVTTEFEIVS